MHKTAGVGVAVSPAELRTWIHGLEAFVCTPFDDTGDVDIDRFRTHLRDVVDSGPEKPAGCFICCGAGEFFSLALGECNRLIAAAVAEVGREVPVVTGVGYGTRTAVEFARAAEANGAHGILVFPPYLVAAPQAGLYKHFRTVAESVGIGVILYNRDNAVLDLDTMLRLAEIPNVIGIKDGHGDIEKLRKLHAAVGDRLILINGMPSAETYAPAYFEAGITSYSSGVFDFLPHVAHAFYRAMADGNKGEIDRLMEVFYRPYTDLRSLVPGYGISLVKAALRLQGRAVGGVRPPLTDPTPEHMAVLQSLLDCV